MYHIRVRILIVCLFSVVLFSFSDCNKSCWGEYCSDFINFKLLEQNTQNDLVFGVAPRYKLDSLQINRVVDFNLGRHSNFITTISGNWQNLQVSTDEPVETMYLRLSYNDIDTINVQYQYIDNDCCEKFKGYGQIINIRYNGEIVQKVGENYNFIKK